MKEEPPIMRQYKALKRELPEYSILALKLGDFYQMFDHDAVRASSIIGATLTTRCGVAMCGFPAHALMNYVAKLNAAHQVFAIAEEMEGRKQCGGLFRREVTRIFYPNNNQQEGTETMNTPNQNTATTEPAPVEEPTAQKKAKRSKPLTPAECEKWQQRQKERNERIMPPRARRPPDTMRNFQPLTKGNTSHEHYTRNARADDADDGAVFRRVLGETRNAGTGGEAQGRGKDLQRRV